MPIRVLHVTAPTCWWSWGYEPVLNRIRLVYGDQVPVETYVGCVYDDREEYLAHYELGAEELPAWAKEAQDVMGTPIATDYRVEAMPKTLLPATVATMAARRQGRQERFLRATLRRAVLALEDVTGEDALLACAREAGCDVERFRRDLADEEGLRADLDTQVESWPHVPVNFYNLVVTDGRRHVVLEHAFDPAEVESAIDWLAGGALRKREFRDVAAYLRDHGPAPAAELARVTARSEAETEAELATLEKKGAVRPTTCGAIRLWETTA